MEVLTDAWKLPYRQDMTYCSGPQIPESDRGRAEAHGYVFSGSDAKGYRARVVVPLTAEEVYWGCEELIFADTLPDLLARAQAQRIVRSMVGQARGEAS